jgi:hydrogenase expression/formation protein HypC
MCIGIPGRVVEVHGDVPGLARVDVQGVAQVVQTTLLDVSPDPGDWVLVYAGLAMSRLTDEEARETLDLLEAIASIASDDPSPVEVPRSRVVGPGGS